MSDPRDLTDGELDSIQILALSEIIREVDGNHSLGAAALAEAILSHPGSRWGRPAPAPAGEVGELAALIRQIALAWEPDACLLGNMTAGQFTRVADLLEELERVAYAASDFICGTLFPEFANEHGGIDRLTADLRRLVAQFEHGPRPVPGVDVPGPDGDWGGLEELCNAEGVDPRIGVPLLQRAQEAWKNALAEGIGPRSDMVEWACLLRPSAPEPAREAADLAATLLQISDGASACGDEVTSWTTARAAKLLQRLDLYEKELSAVMPSDFKDWWENSKDEWPSVAARVIESLRRREEWALEQLGRQAAPVRRHIYPTPHQIAECGGPCEQGGPEACDCGLYYSCKSTH